MVITEADTNILSDVLSGVPPLSILSKNALDRAADEGIVIISTIGYAELAGSFASPQDFKEFIRNLGIILSDVDEATAFLAGQFYREYRLRGALAPASCRTSSSLRTRNCTHIASSPETIASSAAAFRG